MFTYENSSQPPLGDVLAEGQEQGEPKLKPQQAPPVSESHRLARQCSDSILAYDGPPNTLLVGCCLHMGSRMECQRPRALQQNMCGTPCRKVVPWPPRELL